MVKTDKNNEQAETSKKRRRIMLGYVPCLSDQVVLVEVIGENDEGRSGIVHPNAATYHTNKVLVREILGISNITTLTSLENCYQPEEEGCVAEDSHRSYRKGEVVDLGSPLDDFVTLDATICYHKMLERCFWSVPRNGWKYGWNDDGVIEHLTKFDGKKAVYSYCCLEN